MRRRLGARRPPGRIRLLRLNAGVGAPLHEGSRPRGGLRGAAPLFVFRIALPAQQVEHLGQVALVERVVGRCGIFLPFGLCP